MDRIGLRCVRALLLAMLIPSVASAQASITGVVKDASGAVLPRVTVEAASPALIEKARSVVTDGSGQYRIVALPPGTSLNLDLYNALNGNAVLQQSNTFGNWQQPQGVPVGRSMKMSVQYNF